MPRGCAGAKEQPNGTLARHPSEALFNSGAGQAGVQFYV